MPQKLTPEIIRAAIAGFEQQKQQIDAQIADLRAMLPGGNPHPNGSEAAQPKRRRLSAAARRRIAAAQKARWAKIHSSSDSSAAPEERPKPKRRISPEGMKRIIAATKKRWAMKRAEAANVNKARPQKRPRPQTQERRERR